MTSDHQDERFRSSLPTQSLALMNSQTVLRASQVFRDKVLEQTNNNPGAAVTLAFEEMYNRPPTAREADLAKQSIAADTDPREGLRLFIQAMFGANNFLYSF